MKRLVSVASLFLAYAVACAAHAQTQGQDFIEAKKRMAEGKALFLKGRFEESRQLYEKACPIIHTDNCLRSLALAELRAGRPLESYRHWKDYFASPTAFANIDSAGRKELEGYKKEAYDRTGHLRVTAAPNSRVSLDGAYVGTAPLQDEIDVMPGEHSLDAALGDKGAHATANAIAGTSITVTLAFDVQPVVDPPPPVAATNRPATAPATIAAPPSRSAGAEERVGHVSATGTITRWTLTGTSVAALGAGFVFGALSQAKADDAVAFQNAHPQGCANSASAVCAQYRDLQSSQKTDATMSAFLLAIGAVSGVAAIGTWLWWPKENGTETHAWIAPSVQRDGAGVRVVGQF